jgi:hypothetical protein
MSSSVSSNLNVKAAVFQPNPLLSLCFPHNLKNALFHNGFSLFKREGESIFRAQQSSGSLFEGENLNGRISLIYRVDGYE